jgi:hypothetical protein
MPFFRFIPFPSGAQPRDPVPRMLWSGARPAGYGRPVGVRFQGFDVTTVMTLGVILVEILAPGAEFSFGGNVDRSPSERSAR